MRSTKFEATWMLIGGAWLGACAGSSSPGTLVGDYAVRGVLQENTCGTSALATVNPLTYSVQVREDDGVGYWVLSKSTPNTGKLASDGTFRFSVSQSKLLSDTTTTKQLEPSDFLASGASGTDFDLKKTTCAVSIIETIEGSLVRRQDSEGRVVTSTSASSDSDSTSDLVAQDTIVVTPSSGSDCNAQLSALGGSYLALPCQASYELRGALDTSKVKAAGGAGAAGTSGAGGNAASDGDAEQPEAGSGS